MLITDQTQVLEAFHHPYYNTGSSPIQAEMFKAMQDWVQGLGSDSDRIINCLTKVSNHRSEHPLYFADVSCRTVSGRARTCDQLELLVAWSRPVCYLFIQSYRNYSC